MKKIYTLFTFALLFAHISYAGLTSDKLNYLIKEGESVSVNSKSSEKEVFVSKFNQLKNTNITSGQQLTDIENQIENLINDYVLKAQPINGYAFDYTFLMSNPGLTENNIGWTENPTVGNGVAEIYNRTFDMYQVLKNMPEGNYELSVQGFFRTGNYYKGIEEEPNSDCAIYGNEQKKPIKTLYEEVEAKQFKNNVGGYANGMSDAYQVFSQGYYANNKVAFYQHEDDDMYLGIRNTSVINGNWSCFKDFNLKYLGNSGPKISTQYRICCPYYGDGSVLPGEYTDKEYNFYYNPSIVTGDEGFWYITEEKKGKYSIRNVASGKYITWDGIRIESTKRYMESTPEMRGDSSLWTLDRIDETTICIRNVYKPDEVWDTRNGSQLVGTYTNGGTPSNYQKFILYDIMGDIVTDLNVSSFNKGVRNIKFNNSQIAFNQFEKNYLAGVSLNKMKGETYSPVITYTKKEGWGNLFINGKEIQNGASYKFDGINADSEYILSVTDDSGNELSSYLYFTGLPIVQISGNFSPTYSAGTIRVFEADSIGVDTLINARIRWRGASTLYRNKKQYAIKLYDPSGVSMDKCFFGLRNDNNWILDGMCIDVARMRNRVTTDLLQSYSAKPYYFSQEPGMINGTRGQFVEVFLNDQYIGLYCMTEKMDRKQLKLKKYDDVKDNIRGLLYKGNEWSYSVFMGHDYDSNYYPMKSPVMYNNQSDAWDGYETKYPDLGDGEPISWDELYNAVDFVCTAQDKDFVREIGDYFDMPVLMDYYILMESILSADNHGKNMFFFIYNRNKDKKISFGPWDLDSTFGRRWNSQKIDPEQDYTDYITANEHGDYNLFKRVKELNVDNFQDSVRYRYKALRQNKLHTDTIIKLYADYKEMFDLTGASNREVARWNNTDAGTLNFDDELNYLSEWITKRMNYLDNMWDIAGLPDIPTDPSGIENITNADVIESIGAGKNGIIIKCNAETEVNVYSVSGQLVVKASLNEGINEIILQKGIYIVNNRKIVLY